MTETKTETTTKTNLKLQARQAAIARMIEDYRDDFDHYMAEEYRQRGLVYERPLNEAEKAQKEILALIEKHGQVVLPEPGEIASAVKAHDAQPKSEPEPDVVGPDDID